MPTHASNHMHGGATATSQPDGSTPTSTCMPCTRHGTCASHNSQALCTVHRYTTAYSQASFQMSESAAAFSRSLAVHGVEHALRRLHLQRAREAGAPSCAAWCMHACMHACTNPGWRSPRLGHGSCSAGGTAAAAAQHVACTS